MNERKKIFIDRGKKVAQMTFKEKLWLFVNSNFCIFLLSSVLLAGISNYVSNNIQKRQIKIENRKQVIRYATELDYRLSKLDANREYYIMTYTGTRVMYAGSKANMSPLATPEQYRKRDSMEHSVLESIHKFGEEEYLSTITGSEPYLPTEKSFERQHLVSIISWFRFNLDPPINTKKEIEAVYKLVNGIWVNEIDGDSLFTNNMPILKSFSEQVSNYLKEND